MYTVALLASRIIGALDEQALSIRRAANLTGFAAADYSRIRTADLGRFSIDRLIKILVALDEGIEASIAFTDRPEVDGPSSIY